MNLYGISLAVTIDSVTMVIKRTLTKHLLRWPVNLPNKFIHSFQWVLYCQRVSYKMTLESSNNTLSHYYVCFLEECTYVCIFEEWVWNDAGIGNVYIPNVKLRM